MENILPEAKGQQKGGSMFVLSLTVMTIRVRHVYCFFPTLRKKGAKGFYMAFHILTLTLYD
jgi:hypothetical protein